MHLLHHRVAAIVVWLRRSVAALRRDRGDSPIPTAVIVAGMAVIAVGVLLWAIGFVNGITSQAPTQLPGFGGGD